MNKRIFSFLLICAVFPSLFAQTETDYKGFDFFVSAGMYKGNSYHATYYNGWNDDINIRRVLGNPILMNTINRLVSERSDVILDEKGILLDEVPAKMHYNWSFGIQLGLNYYFSPEWALTLSVEQTKLRTVGTAVFVYNKGVIGNQTKDYLHYSLMGSERRNFLELGIRYLQPSDNYYRWFFEFAAQLNSIDIENADLVIEDENFTMIDYYGGAPYDPTISQVEIDPMLGGVGFGIRGSLGLRLKINNWAALEPCAHVQLSRFHLGEYTRIKPNYELSVRIVLRDRAFLKNR